MSKRLKVDERKRRILDAALNVAAEPGGWRTLTRGAVARRADCSDALVSKYFGTMKNFRRTIMRHAITVECLPVIIQGIVEGSPHAQSAAIALKAAAITQFTRLTND